MNKVVLIGRLVRNPEVRYGSGDNSLCIANYTLAVDRRFKREGEPQADFIRCVVFGKSAEFAEKYFTQGLKICVSGRITTGSYTNKDGIKVYTTEVTVEEQEFVESKGQGSSNGYQSMGEQVVSPDDDKFTEILNDIEDDMPF